MNTPLYKQQLPMYEPQSAVYTDTGTTRYKGNPFIEALPPMPESKIDFAVLVSNYPDAPPKKMRSAGEIVRLVELETLGDVIYPFEQYANVALATSMMIRESLKSRNPMTILDVRRRHAMAVATEKDLEKDRMFLPQEWRSTAKSHLMVANSGAGKSTFIDRYLSFCPQLIQHKEYKGVDLRHLQLVYIKLRVPHDGSLKGLCFQFFQEIDRLLGTNYLKEARAVGTISTMTLLMQKVVTATSLSLIVIDEFQNLRSAQGRHAEHVKNLIGELMEWSGVSILLISTPAIDKVIQGNLGNARKMTTLGETYISAMKKGSPTWQQFCETLWEYTYVKNKNPLTSEILTAWFNASAGNTAFAKLAFMLAQRNEIGGRELVDEVSFDTVANTDLLFLRPAIRSLLSQKASEMVEFDDLFISAKYKELRSLFGVVDEKPKAHRPVKEFAEIEDSANAKKRTRSVKKIDTGNVELSEEDPLLLDE